MPISSNRRQRVIEFATPKVADLVVVERVDASKNINAASTADDNAYGTAHPDTTKFPNFKLALIKNGDNDQGQFQDWYYVKDRENQDDYNWEFQAAGAGSPRFDTVVRTYVILRSSYGATSPLIGHNTANNTEALLNAGQLKDSNTFMPSGDTSLTPFDTDSSGAVAVLSGPDSGGSTISGSVKYNKDYILFEKKQVRSGDETLDSLYVVEQRVFIKRVSIVSVDSDNEFPYNDYNTSSKPFGGLISKETLFHKDEDVKATVEFFDDDDSDEGVTNTLLDVNAGAGDDNRKKAEYVFTDKQAHYTDSGDKYNFWGIDQAGVMREGKQLSDNWYALFERQVISKDSNGIVAQYNTTKNMGWPAVFATLYTQKWPRRDGTSQLILYPVFKRESYDGPTPMLIENYWRKTPFDAPDSAGGATGTHTKLAQIKPMEPMAMSYTTPMFSVNVKKCLHGEESLIYTTGTDDAVWDYIEYKANWKKTNYDNWPASIVISDDQRPFRGGYLRTKVTAYRPETGRADSDFDSDFGVVPVSQKPANP